MTVGRQARLWQWAAVGYGVCAVLFLLYFPSVVVDGYSRPLLQVLGPSMLVPVTLPVVAAALPAILPWRKALIAWIVAGCLLVFIIATALSVGLIYLPAALFTGVAAYLHGRAPIEDAPPEPDDWPRRRI
ncbi:MAG: hypothetical protein ACOH1Y_07735 [Propionicimonas sp.]